MKEWTRGVLMAVLVLTPGAAFALSGAEVLKKMDAAEFSPKDYDGTVKLVLKDKDGTKSERKLKVFQKGNDKRLIKFLEPAEVKGIAFLDAGADKMYVFMPAFHKIRRIASHVKNENFAGTDFSYEDLHAEQFSGRVDVETMEEDAEHFVLFCKPKSTAETAYSKLKISVRKKDFMFDRVEFFDESGKPWKILNRQDFRVVGGYTQSFLMEMTDLKKSHSTQMIMESLKPDVGLEDRFFSKRQIKR